MSVAGASQPTSARKFNRREYPDTDTDPKVSPVSNIILRVDTNADILRQQHQHVAASA